MSRMTPYRDPDGFDNHPRRLPYYVAALDVDSPHYNQGDSDSEDGWGELRHPCTGPEANAWSSHCWRNPALHSPVIDVDKPRTPELERIVNDTLGAWPGWGFSFWVPSVSADHWHVFVDVEMPWESYLKTLERLDNDGVIERGYLRASEERRATFVRMRHVRKRADHQPKPSQG